MISLHVVVDLLVIDLISVVSVIINEFRDLILDHVVTVHCIDHIG